MVFAGATQVAIKHAGMPHRGIQFIRRRQLHSARAGSDAPQSRLADPLIHGVRDDVVGELVVFLGQPIGVGHLGLVPMAEQEDLAARAGVEAGGVFEVVLFHHQDEVGPARDLGGELARDVGREVDAVAQGDALGGLVRGMADEGADAGRGHRGRAAARGEAVAQQELGERAAADVSGAEGEDLVEHGGVRGRRVCGGRGAVERDRGRPAWPGSVNAKTGTPSRGCRFAGLQQPRIRPACGDASRPDRPGRGPAGPARRARGRR